MIDKKDCLQTPQNYYFFLKQKNTGEFTHWTMTKHGVQCNEVIKFGGMQLAKIIPNTF